MHDMILTDEEREEAEQAAAENWQAEYNEAMYHLSLFWMLHAPAANSAEFEEYVSRRDKLKVTDKEVAEYAARYMECKAGQMASEKENPDSAIPF